MDKLVDMYLNENTLNEKTASQIFDKEMKRIFDGMYKIEKTLEGEIKKLTPKQLKRITDKKDLTKQVQELTSELSKTVFKLKDIDTKLRDVTSVKAD